MEDDVCDHVMKILSTTVMCKEMGEVGQLTCELQWLVTEYILLSNSLYNDWQTDW